VCFCPAFDNIVHVFDDVAACCSRSFGIWQHQCSRVERWAFVTSPGCRGWCTGRNAAPESNLGRQRSSTGYPRPSWRVDRSPQREIPRKATHSREDVVVFRVPCERRVIVDGWMAWWRVRAFSSGKR
jgi:hypothetical protein